MVCRAGFNTLKALVPVESHNFLIHGPKLEILVTILKNVNKLKYEFT